MTSDLERINRRITLALDSLGCLADDCNRDRMGIAEESRGATDAMRGQARSQRAYLLGKNNAYEHAADILRDILHGHHI